MNHCAGIWIVQNQMRKKVTETKENFSKIVKTNENLRYEFEIIQCKSMRDNLLFHGLKKKEEGDCIQLIKRICSNDLGIEDDYNIIGSVKK